MAASVNYSDDRSTITSAVSCSVVVDGSAATFQTLVTPPVEVPRAVLTVRVCTRSANVLISGVVPVSITVGAQLPVITVESDNLR